MPGTIVLLLAAIFLLAATAKLRSRDAFADVLHDLMPSALVSITATVVPMIELALAAALLNAADSRIAAAAALVLLAGFTIVLVVLWRRGAKSCGCFGETTANDNNGSGIIRNVALIALATYALTQRGSIEIWGPDISTVLARLTIVAGALCLWSTSVAIYNNRSFIFNYTPPSSP